MKNSNAFKYLLAILLGAALFWAGQHLNSTRPAPSLHLIYAHSESGETLAGSKENLINAVRAGKHIRVYFRGRRVEHLSDAAFITVFGDEVFAQIRPIEAQNPSLDPPQIRFRHPGIKWHAILSTTGEFTAFTDGKEPNVRTQAVKWYVQD